MKGANNPGGRYDIIEQTLKIKTKRLHQHSERKIELFPKLLWPNIEKKN